ncbi:hypothetical protein AMECASPLE_012589 [Ameca splendens]|uniref:Uncharacterized protein n=1 Tax=Ameca splendens TaxID=208324 RepID=A0ABV0Z0I6_9TELE
METKKGSRNVTDNPWRWRARKTGFNRSRTFRSGPVPTSLRALSGVASQQDFHKVQMDVCSSCSVSARLVLLDRQCLQVWLLELQDDLQSGISAPCSAPTGREPIR